MKSIEFIDRTTGKIVQENPPGEGFLKFLYHNPLGQLPLHLLIKRKLVSSIYGNMMDKPKSRKKIAPFVETYKIDMTEAVKAVDEFTSFNDFFYRKLKPSARPLQEGIVSPADGKIIAFENISAVRNFYVKGLEFTLEAFLQDKELAKKYEGAALFIIRLAPNDYHRFHFPYDGIPTTAHPISGSYYSVSPYATTVNFAKVFCENKREYTILKTQDKGDILLSPVGATMVGSILETYTPNANIKKGDEMGYFAFGGSSILMLVEKGKISIDADLLHNTQKGMETFIKLGERIGH